MFKSKNGTPMNSLQMSTMCRAAGFASAKKRWGFDKSVSEENHFWSKVEKKKADKCWWWKPCRGKNKYGLFKETTAHRFSLQLKLGRSILPDKWALHTCDHKNCVNPNHLWEGNAADNSKDMVEKNRQSRGARHSKIVTERTPRGSDNGNSKLTEIQVKKIRNLYATGKWSMKDLAAKFNVTRPAIGYTIKKGWRHI